MALHQDDTTLRIQFEITETLVSQGTGVTHTLTFLLAADQACSCVTKTVHEPALLRLPRLTCCHQEAVQDVWAPSSDTGQRLFLLSNQLINQSINQATNRPTD